MLDPGFKPSSDWWEASALFTAPSLLLIHCLLCVNSNKFIDS